MRVLQIEISSVRRQASGTTNLVFCGAPGTVPYHVAIYIGGGLVISHGADPVGRFPYTAMSPVQQFRSYV